MILLMIVILLYYITNFKIFYYIGYFIALCWLFSIGFIIGTFISVYIILF